MRYSLLAVLVSMSFVVVLQACSSKTAEPTEKKLLQSDIAKVDVHTHYFRERDYLNSFLDDWRMRAVIVDLSRGENPDRQSWKNILQVEEKHPNRTFLCTSFDGSRLEEPDFAQKTIAQLREDINRGAVMVKVWKNIGMIYKDGQGNYIQIDDPRFQPIWNFLAEQNIPVLAHIGEPRAAWQPLDKKSPHYTYYKNHPQYHNYKNDEVPSWETIMEARDNWLEKNPNLSVIGAHLGSMAYDVDEIAKRFEAYPNFYVDTAERFGDLAIQDPQKVRHFFTDYQDRILYGTDLRSWTPVAKLTDDGLRKEEEGARKRMQIHWDYLAGQDSMTFERTGSSFTAQTKGLNLSREVLEKVYHQNAERLLGL